VHDPLAEEAEALEQTAARPRRPWLRYLLTVAVLALAVKLVLPQLGPLQESLLLLHTMVPAYLLLAVVSQVASYVWSAVMLRDIVRLTGDRVSLTRAIAISLGSGSVGLVAGGALGTAGVTFRWLRDAGVSPEGALLAGWLPTVLNGAMVVLLGIVGTVELVLVRGLTTAEWTALGLAFAVVGAACGSLWWAGRHPAQAERLAVAMERRWARARKHRAREAQVRERVAASYAALDLLRRRGWRRPALASALTVGFDALTLWLTFVALLSVISPHLFFAGYGIPMLVAKVGVIPGGIGLVEGMMVAIFHHMGQETRLAVLAVVAYRLIAFWLPNLLGFAILPFLQAPGKAEARVRRE
jgi:hypothetical protein